jgi:phosphotransferase system  glucose/maltose/N-acetylglucosamine-specific IIC component
VIAGIIVWMLHERFHNIRLPDALAFFGGTRLCRLSPPWCSGWSAWLSPRLAGLCHGD